MSWHCCHGQMNVFGTSFTHSNPNPTVGYGTISLSGSAPLISSAYQFLSCIQPRFTAEPSSGQTGTRDNRPCLLIYELFAALRLHPDTPCLASAACVGRSHCENGQAESGSCESAEGSEGLSPLQAVEETMQCTLALFQLLEKRNTRPMCVRREFKP